jgi:hypothetical protein
MRNALFFVSLIFLITCSGKKESLTITNDLEGFGGWGLTGIVKGNSHSGEYAYKVDSTQLYSLTFKKTLKEISSKPVKKIKASVWVYFTSKEVEGGFIVSIDPPEDKSIIWEAADLKKFITMPNQWIQITSESTVPENIDPSNIISIYAYNTGKKEFLLDDFEITFEN